MKLLASYNIWICFAFIFILNSCSSQTKSLQIIEKKVTKENLELFFEQKFEAMGINDVPIPVSELKTAYQSLIIKSYRNSSLGWQANDSIVFSENKLKEFILSKSGKILEQKKYYPNGFLQHHKFIYDKNDKLIEKQSLDNNMKIVGEINYNYTENYLKMYELIHNYKTASIDTTRSYEFDSKGNVTNFQIYNNSIAKKIILSYNEKGLISNVIQITVFQNDPNKYEVQYNLNYKYNSFGDWIELLINFEQNSNKEELYKYVREFN